MQRVRVKIEGLRDAATAVKIAQMGADAIGLVFAESPRWVSPEQARAIVAALPPWVATVGVFVNADPTAINRVVERTRIGYVQLHGDEPPQIVSQITVPCIKAFPVRDEGWLAEVRDWLEALGDRRHLAAVLLDALQPRGARRHGSAVQLVDGGRCAGRGGDEGPGPDHPGGWAGCWERRPGHRRRQALGGGRGQRRREAPGVKDLKKVADFIRATREGNELHSEFWT